MLRRLRVIFRACPPSLPRPPWGVLRKYLAGKFLAFLAPILTAAPLQDSPPPTGWFNSMLRWENSHAALSGGIVQMVERIDRLFGDERLDDDGETRLRLRMGLRYTRQDELSFESSLRARLDLPQLEKRLQLIIDDDVEDETGRVGAAFRDSRPDAALRFLFDESARHRSSVDAGLRISGPTQAFGRWRGRLVLTPGQWDLRLVQTFAWFTATGPAQTSEMRWTRALPARWWFRSVSRLEWEEIVSGVTLHQTLFVGRELSERRAFRWALSGTWPEIPHPRETVYAVEFTYRQRLHQDWLYGELAPALSFHQSHDYQSNPGVTFRLEVLFGDSWRRPARTE